jgi:hypothetical protein
LRAERFDRYRDDDKPKVKNVKFVFTHNDAAYSDVLGNRLDFLGNVPPQGLADNLWQDDLPGRAKAYPIMAIQTIAFPAVRPEIRRRRPPARDLTHKPINGYAMNLVPGYRDGACGNPDSLNAWITSRTYPSVAANITAISPRTGPATRPARSRIVATAPDPSSTS